MLFLLPTSCFLLTLFFLPLSAFGGALDQIKKTYAEIQTVEARFQQKIQISTLKRERDMKGDFFYKRGKGFLWRYSTPKPKIFLYDGTAIWQVEDDKPYAVKDRVNKGKMEGNFLDLVEDIAKLDQFFSLKEQNKQGDLEVLELAPLKDGTIRSARIWVDKNYLITKLEFVEITGNVNTIEFSSIKVNKPVDSALFVFKPGTKEVVER